MPSLPFELPSSKQIFVKTLQVHQLVYEGTRGLIGHRILMGMPALMLRTTGRRSGLTRTNALVYGKDGDRLMVVASNGGYRKPPAWLLNLQADPSVEVQVGVRRWPGTATPVWPGDADYDAAVRDLQPGQPRPVRGLREADRAAAASGRAQPELTGSVTVKHAPLGTLRWYSTLPPWASTS